MTTTVRVTHRGGNHEVKISTRNPEREDVQVHQCTLKRVGEEREISVHQHQTLIVEEGDPI